MPRGNQTGPQGQGPMTGRGLGYCGGSGQTARWRQRYWHAPDSPVSPVVREPESDREQEVRFLETQRKSLQTELADLDRRLSQLSDTDD